MNRPLWQSAVVALLMSFAALPAGAVEGGDGSAAVERAPPEQPPAPPAEKKTAPATSKKADKKPDKKADKKAAEAKVKRQKWPVKRPAVTPEPPELGPMPFPPGERLVFKVNMLGSEAGEVMLMTGEPSTLNGRTVLPLAGHVRSSEFLTKFYPVEDRLLVLVDEKTFVPLKTDFFINENGKKLSYHTLFDQRNRLIVSTRDKQGKKLQRNFTTGGVAFEALSSVYAARRLDLKPGLEFQYFVWDGRRERLVDIKVTKIEKVWTPAGWFEAHRVDIVSRVTGGFIKMKDIEDQEPKRGSAWFATDEHRTPVKVTTPTKLGQAEGLLVRRFVEPAKGGPKSAAR